MKNVIIYSRVSTTKQSDDGVSLDAQVQKCRDWAKSQGYEVAAEFQDVASGAKSGRDGMQAAIQRTIKGKGVLLCYSLSRLSRSTIKCIELVEMLGKKGCSFVSLVDGELNSDTPQSQFILSIYSSVAQLERRMIGQRTATALRHMRSKGMNIYSKIPYGYDLDSTGKMLVRNEAEQATIARMIKMKNCGSSLGKIANQLNSEAIPSKQNCTWGRGSVYALLKREMNAETVAA